MTHGDLHRWVLTTKASEGLRYARCPTRTCSVGSDDKKVKDPRKVELFDRKKITYRPKIGSKYEMLYLDLIGEAKIKTEEKYLS